MAFVIFGLLIFAAVAALLRNLLGRLLGSTAAAAVTGVFAWLVGTYVILAAIIAVAAFFLALFGDRIIAASDNANRNARRGRGRRNNGAGGVWLNIVLPIVVGGLDAIDGSASGSRSSDSDISGGGGSFGGGGASGSW